MPRSVPLLPNDPQISPGAILFAELQPATIEDLVEFDGPIAKLRQRVGKIDTAVVIIQTGKQLAAVEILGPSARSDKVATWPLDDGRGSGGLRLYASQVAAINHGLDRAAAEIAEQLRRVAIARSEVRLVFGLDVDALPPSAAIEGEGLAAVVNIRAPIAEVEQLPVEVQ
jgi:hypothetical protein